MTGSAPARTVRRLTRTLSGMAIALALVLGPAGVSVAPTPAAAAATGGGPRSIILTPTARPATSQTVNWRTSGATTGRLEVRSGTSTTTYPARLRDQVSARTSGENAYQYAATATALRPDTRYAYRVVTNRGATVWYSFRTAAASAVPWSFLAFGDTQVANAGVPEDIIDAATRRFGSHRLLLHAGDVVNKPYVYPEWREFLQATSPSRHERNWLISMGNHEQCQLVKACRSGGGEAFKAYYSWPRNGYAQQGSTWFATDYQGVRFVVLDTFGPDLARQGKFLDWALRTNPNRWSVVLEHAGPFAARADRTNAGVRKHILPVIMKRKVDLVLSGHDHSYARGYLGSRHSTVFATSVSGRKFYTSSRKDWLRNRATRVIGAGQTATYQIVTVDGSTLRYRAVIGYKGSTSTTSKKVGQVLDSFTITKKGAVKTVR